MSQEKKSIFGFITVFGILGGLIAGIGTRSWIEMGPSLPESKGAGVSVENLLASADEKMPLSDAEYFYQLTQKLEQDYVEPIKDKSVLGTGAVRGMVSSLADPSSIFFDKKKWTITQERLAGMVTGIGVDLELKYNQTELAKLRKSAKDVDQLLLIPDLYVASVAAGSPAAKAGMAAGDQIVGVNGSWVMSGTEISTLRLEAQKANAAEMSKIRTRMAELADKSMTPARAEELLSEESSGSVEVVFKRAGTSKKDTIARGVTELPPLQVNGGQVAVNLIEGVVPALQELRLSSGVLDFRGEMAGKSDMTVPVLEALVGGGTYGEVSREAQGTARPVLGMGPPKSASGWTVLIDEFTAGPALIVARTMQARGAALVGKSNRASEWIDTVPLVDGSGYTLVTGIFKAAKS